MFQKGLTRGDGLIFLCVALIFGFSFAPYYKLSQSSGRSSFDESSSSSSSGDSETYNAWAQTHWPLMAVVILLPLLAFLALVLHRYTQNAEQRPVGGLTLRQWATAFGVVTAWSALWSLGGNAVGVADSAFEQMNVESEHGFGAFVILPFTLLMALLLLIGDRVPGLAYPLFVAAPQYPAGYVPMQPNYGTGMYAQPGAVPPMGTQSVPPGTPIAHMPPPMPSGMTGAVPAAAPLVQDVAPAPAASAPGAPAPASAPPAEFEQFWLAVPEERPLLPVGGLDKTPVATLVTGNWYLAVDAAGDGLVVEVDGVRGVLWNTAGIQRGE